MATKLSDQMAYPPRAMRAERAAAYLSMSRAAFLRLVEDGTMPAPVKIKGIVLWDRLELDAAFDKLRESEVSTVKARLNELQRLADAGVEPTRKRWSARDAVSYRDLPKRR
jgi:predicted DNA-binding transcriptional regulator AlpA